MSIREDLELDIADALSNVDKLGAALDQAATQLKVALADAISILSVVKVEEVDTSAVTEGIDSAVAAADTNVGVTAQVDADTAPAEGEIAALDSEPVTVEVDADTAPAQEQLDGLGASGTQAAEGLDAASASAAGFAVAGGLASKNIGGLGSKIEAVGPQSAAAVGGITAVAAVLGVAFEKAVAATAAQDRFNQTFGDLAPEVERVNVGNLDRDLGDLSVELGSIASGVRNAASNFGQLGVASGASQEEVAKSSDQLVALAARAVALNPALGSVGDVAGRMGRALSRGGRFAADFKVALTTDEIAARALADTGKLTTSELTFYDKAAAGAAIATEKYGDSLDQAITKGSESPIIQLRKLEVEFSKALTEIGQPLVVPIIDILTKAEPIFISFARTLGAVGTVAIAVLGPMLDIFSRLPEPIQATAVAIGLLAAVGKFSLVTRAAEGVGRAFDRMAISAFDAVGSVSTLAGALAGAGALGAIVAITVATEKLSDSLARGTFGDFAGQADRLSLSLNTLAGTGKAIGILANDLPKLATGFKTVDSSSQGLLNTIKGYAAIGGVGAVIGEINRGKADEFQKQVDAIDKSLVQMFHVDPSQAKAAFEGLRNLLILQGDAAEDVNAAFDDYNQAVNDANDANDAAASGAFDVAKALNLIFSETVKLQQAQTNATTATRASEDAQRRLNDINRQAAEVDLQHRQNVLSLAQAQQGLLDVQDRLAHVGEDQQKANIDLREANLDLADAQTKVAESFTPGTTPEERERAQIALERATLRVKDAQDAVNTTNDEGSRLSLELSQAQLGVESAQQRLNDEGPAAVQRAQDQQRAEEDLTTAIQNQQLALLSLAAFQAQIGPAIEAGQAIGRSLGAAVSAGLISEQTRQGIIARVTIQLLKDAMTSAAQIHSPSRVFTEIGQNIGAGVTAGLSDAADAAVREAELIVSRSFEAMQQAARDSRLNVADPAQNLVVAGEGAGPGGITIGQVVVQVTASPGVSDAQAKAQGHAAAEGFVEGLSRNDIADAVRAS